MAYKNIVHVTSLCARFPKIVFGDSNGIIECLDLCAYSSVVFMNGMSDAGLPPAHGGSPGHPLRTR
jgi:hypothetical protein